MKVGNKSRHSWNGYSYTTKWMPKRASKCKNKLESLVTLAVLGLVLRTHSVKAARFSDCISFGASSESFRSVRVSAQICTQSV